MRRQKPKLLTGCVRPARTVNVNYWRVAVRACGYLGQGRAARITQRLEVGPAFVVYMSSIHVDVQQF